MNQEPPITPVVGGVDDFPEPAAWPKPIGITSIVWSAVALGCLSCGLAGTAMPLIMPMDQAFPDGMPPLLTDPPLLLWAAYLFSALINLWLLACGITLVMRKPAARPMHLAYAVAGIVSAVFGAWLSLHYQAQIAEWVRQNPDTKFAQGQQGGSAIVGQVIMVVSIIVGLAWPVFCLIWFGFVKRDAGEISRHVRQVM